MAKSLYVSAVHTASPRLLVAAFLFTRLQEVKPMENRKAAVNRTDVIRRAIARNRRGQGMSQTELARLTGLTRFGVLEIEKGYRTLSVEDLLVIAWALGMTSEELLRGAGGE